MNCKRSVQLALAAAVSLFTSLHPALGQTFNSGSTGADGPLNVTANTNITVRPGGVYNYTTVNIAANQTLRYFRNTDNSPVVILASGDVTISGTIDVSGVSGVAPGFGQTGPNPGGAGGPGGFNGGNGAFISTNPPVTIPSTAGQGPGGGVAGPNGGLGGQGGTYGAPTAFVALTPLFGGSGGGGGGDGQPGNGSGSGGGGGGAILIASNSRIILNGFVRANGASTSGSASGCARQAGAGAGGVIRLVAPEVAGSGVLQALRGVQPTNCGAALPSDGRIRVEAFSAAAFTGSATPVASVATAPGPVSAAGNPQLANVPTLAIASIAGVAVPANPVSSYSTPDITLPLGTANPVPVVLSATNTPVGSPTVITVRLIPQGTASAVTVASTNHTGSFASSTATANVTLPVGQVTVLQAHAAMTLTGQTASLFPLIDGEPVTQVAMAAYPGHPSSLSLITRSGREVALDKLTPQERTRVAQAWQAMQELR